MALLFTSVHPSKFHNTNKYDANGQRTQKTSYGSLNPSPATTTYYYDGTRLIYEKRDRTSGSDENIWYYYDASGDVVGFELNNVEYYYVKNLQGDVTQIVDKNNTVVVEYTYEPFGGLASMTGSLKDTVGKANLIRYRSYYFDDDMGFYYLNSRYYDPVTGRFINADEYTSTGQGIEGHNMYTYCLNNPVMLHDSTGTLPDDRLLHNVVEWESGRNGSFLDLTKYESTIGPVTSPVDHSNYRNDAPSAKYGSNRSGGRKHKGVDYYPSDSKNNLKYGSDGTAKPVRSMAKGKVIDYIPNFYAGTAAVVIDHETFKALYGEISTDLRKGDTIAQGDQIGTMQVSWDETLMLHLEIFKGGYGNYSRNNPYRVDPTYTYDLSDWR